MDDLLLLYTDGASRGNPGRASIGAVLYRGTVGPAHVVEELRRAIGHTTSNVAEYRAVIEGLEMAARHEPGRLVLRSDSQLLVRQLMGDYRVRSPALRPLFARVRELLEEFPEVRIEHISRRSNSHADRLANQALDS